MDGKIVGRQSSKERNRTSRESRGDRMRRITSNFYFSSHANYNPILVEEDAIIIFIRFWAYLIPLDICSPSWENEYELILPRQIVLTTQFSWRTTENTDITIHVHVFVVRSRALLSIDINKLVSKQTRSKWRQGGGC